MKQFLPCVFILLTYLSANAQYCTNDYRFSNIPYFSDGQISSQLNVTYANAIDWQGNSIALKLDVYYPALSIDTMPLRPFILLVHGGGLISGDKSNYTSVCKEFAKRGFVAVTINYRLGRDCAIDSLSEEKARYRVQQDINAALRFSIQNASTIRIDTTWMFLGGGSAGSGASLAVAYISQAEWNNFSPSVVQLLGNLNNSGNNLQHTFSLKGLYNDWGATLKMAIQPEDMLPMVSFHGEADPTVSIDSYIGGGCLVSDTIYGSRAIHNLLLSNGVCSDISVRPGGGHGVYQDSIIGVPFRVGRAACFFKSLFCNNCSSNYQTDSIPASCNLTTSITDFESQKLIQVYPNPFTDKINIYNETGTEIFILTDQFGQTIYSGDQIQEQSFEKLFSGIYFLTITTPNCVKTYKLIK
jgi:hypothetical protein